jgi:hypothetical protein
MAKDLKMERRTVHPALGVPVPATGPEPKEKGLTEEKLLDLLAEDYRVNPGLFMSREDIKESWDVDDATLDDLLASLERKGLAALYRTKKSISLAKATYAGLDKAHPPEYYRWFPEWAGEDRRF